MEDAVPEGGVPDVEVETVEERYVPHIEPPVVPLTYIEEKRDQAAEAAMIKKDPDAYHSKMEAMEAARMRLQSKYDQDVETDRLKRFELEERRRQQDIQDWEDHQTGKGYKNRPQTKVDSGREALERQAQIKGKKGYGQKADFNPLMGGGGGGGFRPAPRRGGGG